MKTAEILKKTAAALIALVLVSSLVPAPALAAEPAFVHIEDTAGTGYVYPLSGDGMTAEAFRYDVPEGGVTALVFFQAGCPNCRSLFQTIAQGALADDPRVNIVAVSLQEREETERFAEAYMGGRVSNVYYGGSGLSWNYARLVLGNVSTYGTAFVLLIAKEEGKSYILWQGQRVHDGWTVQEAVNELLGGGSVRMVKAAENVQNGRVCLLADLRNMGAQAVSGRLWAAGYTGGRLTDLQSLPLTLPANGGSLEDFTVKGETAKLFYLEEGTLRPLAAALAAGG